MTVSVVRISPSAGDENMANRDARAWRDTFSDDSLDFPPTDNPVREFVTFSIFVSGVIALVVWAGSKLLQVIF